MAALTKPILLFCYEFKPDLGGTAELSYSVADALHRRGWGVTVFAREGASADVPLAMPFEVVRALPEGREGMWRGVQGARQVCAIRKRLARTVRERGIAYVLFTENLRLRHGNGFWLGRSLRALGCPCGVVFHGMDILQVAKMRPHRQWMFRKALDSMRDIYCNSRFTAERVREWYGTRANPAVIGCGISPERLAPAVTKRAARERLGLGDGPVLLSVCRLVPRKGVDIMIRALPSIARRHPDITYVVAGGGPDLDRLKALADETGCARQVRFEGVFDDDLLAQYYCAADVFAMPSRMIPGRSVEGFGIVYVEAGHYGLPVIGGRAGGVPDAIVHGETGFLVDPEDPEDAARAVVALLDDPALRLRMGQAGRARADRDLTWDAVAQRIETRIVQTLAADHRD